MKELGQAFNTTEFYDRISVESFMEIAETTGLEREGKSLDASLLLDMVVGDDSKIKRVLEVGCGFGRIGKHFLDNRYVDYVGVDVYQPYVDEFRRRANSTDKRRIILGSFLDCGLPHDEYDAIIFPWSTIGEFDKTGQESVITRSRDLLADDGKILIDVPVDVKNKFSKYEPGPLDVIDTHDLSDLGFQNVVRHSYVTHTGRNREIIELRY